MHRSRVLVRRRFLLPAYRQVTNFCHIFWPQEWGLRVSLYAGRLIREYIWLVAEILIKYCCCSLKCLELIPIAVKGLMFIHCSVCIIIDYCCQCVDEFHDLEHKTAENSESDTQPKSDQRPFVIGKNY